MKGIGQLSLSRENIIEAVQEWLDKQWTVNSPVVTDVTQQHDRVTFRIDLESNKTFVGVAE